MTIFDERAGRVDVARQTLLAHPMCACLVETASLVRVLYPDGDFPVDGCQSAIGAGGKSAAMERLLPVMERHWRESYPGA